VKHPIIILGPGRCGSTLLQRILNTSEEITIWGEHSGFLNSLSKSYYQLTKDKAINKNFYSRNLSIDPAIAIGSLSNYSIDISWLNSFDRELIKTAYRDLILQLMTQKIDTEKSHWGFKEIRYTQHDLALQMWLELFPDTRIIFSIRNPFKVIKSMILAWVEPTRLAQKFENPDSEVAVETVMIYAKRWNDMASSFQYWLAEKENWFCHVDRYEHLVKNPEQEIEKLFAFLDIPVPDTALKPMSVKAGKSPKRSSNYESQVCQAIYFARQDIWKVLKQSAKYFNYDLVSVNDFVE
jgi:Sulfotransferase family